MGGGAHLPGGKDKKGAAGRQQGLRKEPCTCLAPRVISKEGLARVGDGILGHHTQRPEIAGQETQCG